MSSLRRRVEAFTDRLTAITEMKVNLKAQLGELDRLRDRLRKAQLSARRSRLLPTTEAGASQLEAAPHQLGSNHEYTRGCVIEYAMSRERSQ
jgi:hypothetical protein